MNLVSVLKYLIVLYSPLVMWDYIMPIWWCEVFRTVPNLKFMNYFWNCPFSYLQTGWPKIREMRKAKPQIMRDYCILIFLRSSPLKGSDVSYTKTSQNILRWEFFTTTLSPSPGLYRAKEFPLGPSSGVAEELLKSNIAGPYLKLRTWECLAKGFENL